VAPGPTPWAGASDARNPGRLTPPAYITGTQIGCLNRPGSDRAFPSNGTANRVVVCATPIVIHLFSVVPPARFPASLSRAPRMPSAFPVFFGGTSPRGTRPTTGTALRSSSLVLDPRGCPIRVVPLLRPWRSVPGSSPRGLVSSGPISLHTRTLAPVLATLALAFPGAISARCICVAYLPGLASSRLGLHPGPPLPGEGGPGLARARLPAAGHTAPEAPPPAGYPYHSLRVPRCR